MGVFGIAGRFIAPGAGARVPGKYQISDFIGDQQGVDDITTSTVTLLHDKDTVTFINDRSGTIAHFSFKRVYNVKTKALWGTIAQQTEVKTGEFELQPGDVKTFTNAEGATTFMGTGATLNQDIYITLVKVEERQQDGTYKESYVGPGQESWLFNIQWAVQKYMPASVAKRARERRMFIGTLQAIKHPQVGLTPEERAEYMHSVKEGKVTSPAQAAMIRTAYAYDDSRKWKEDLQNRLRPY